MFKHKKLIVFSILLLVALLGGYFALSGTLFKKTVQPQQTAQVSKGSIKVLVSGSGSLISAGTTNVSATSSGTLTSILVKEGDLVKAGQQIASLDDFDANMAVKKAQNNLAQTLDALNTNLRDLKSCNVYAPFEGDISELTIKAGDTIGKGGSILTLTDRSTLRVVVSFKNNLRSQLKVGTPMTLNVFDSVIGETYVVQGKAEHIYPVSYRSADQQDVYNVRILLHNTGSLKEGMVANGEISLNGQTSASITSGTLAFNKTAILKSQAGGTVSQILVNEGETVKAGTLLVKLDNTELQLTTNTNKLKVEQLKNELTTAQRQLNLTKILAPSNGTIASLPFKVGASIKVADVVAVVTDVAHMQFDVPVDELDIAKIKLGQEVSVTVDALPETITKPLRASVSKIAVIGTSTNGVTTYPVTITMKDVAHLKDGMNANGDILITNKTGILLLPIEAVQKNTRGFYVMVKGSRDKPEGTTSETPSTKKSKRNPNGSNTSNQMSSTLKAYYTGSYMKRVETGLSDDTNIEITSNLKEGETVVLPPLTTTTGTSSRIGGFGGPPGIGGSGGGGGGGSGGSGGNSGSGGASGTRNNNNNGNNNH